VKKNLIVQPTPLFRVITKRKGKQSHSRKNKMSLQEFEPTKEELQEIIKNLKLTKGRDWNIFLPEAIHDLIRSKQAKNRA